ncbi:PDZ domain-containing protein [Gammaproteobacteria bacterium]|nr:PDZ domain-containing protein [Gammaproteobacteria bacterium]
MIKLPGQIFGGRNYLALVACCALFCSAPVSAETDDWSEMLERISSGVVSIKIDQTRAFDTERNVSSQATGFIVDAELGLILTNRHVVTPGPVNSEALFLNQEEVSLIPVYRDPVHDFGLFRYDPAALRYIEPATLELSPERVDVGVEIRVVGNDAGEQLSILSGTIAKLDRRAPNYGYGNYSDFNTDYIQAASGVSGGSSGSPVLDKSGKVIALNAGASSGAASSFFLPLDRVKRAVDLIRDGQPVTRGTLEARFVRVAYDELRRLGLRQDTEDQFRKAFPKQTGMLVVSDTMRGGPADGELEIGDILLAVNGERITDFVPLEATLDDSVGKTISLRLERNGTMVEHELSVADLHAITPDEYIQAGEGIFHDLSYQLAWHLNKPIAGVYVAAPGYMGRTAGIPRKSVIVELDGEAVDNLNDFERILESLADGQKAAVRYFSIDDPQGSVVRVIRMDRRWFPATRCVRNDESGLWPCKDLADGPLPPVAEPAIASFVAESDKRLQRIASSLVLVNFDMPYTISGVGDRHYYGTGLVVDAERGLVVVDRNTVPEAMGDVRITFAGSVEVVGKVEFIHPLHNLALLSYDPLLLGDSPVRSAELSMKQPVPADELLAAGLRSDSQLVSQTVQVASIDAVSFALSGTMRFRDTNLETLSLVNPPRGFDGVLLDRRGQVAALWSSFAYEEGGEVYQANKGTLADLVAEMLGFVVEDRPLYSLEAELTQMPLAVARNLGLSDDWVQSLERTDAERRQVLAVVRTVAGTSAAELLQSGDLLLSVDDKPVTRFRQVERATQKPRVKLTVWRNRDEIELNIDTTALDGRGVRRALVWNGALLQEPYRQMAAQRGIEPYGVYVAYFAFGSPASRSGLAAGSRIVEVDGEAVADMDQFIELVRSRPDSDYVRLTTVAWNDAVQVITVKLAKNYWPTWEVLFNGEWHRIGINGNSH